MPKKTTENTERQYVDVEVYIAKLKTVMTRLNINEYDYDWTKDSSYIEFVYKGQYYKFEHSVKKSEQQTYYTRKLKYGTDCFAQLVLSLEDLARMANRGIYDLSVWISGMKYLPEKKLLPQCFQDLGFKYDYPSKKELDKSYKDLLKIVHPDNGGKEENFVKLKKSYDQCLKLL